MTWVGPETVTSLIELHGTAPDALLRPTWEGEPGWPVLLPLAALDALRAVAADRMPPLILDDLIAAGLADRHVDLGDPGVALDVGTARAELPPYVGPLEPAADHVHEWGAAQADAPDDGPLAGPALAPYGRRTSTSAGLAGGVVGRGATAPLPSPISARIERGRASSGHRSPQPRCLPSVAEQQSVAPRRRSARGRTDSS